MRTSASKTETQKQFLARIKRSLEVRFGSLTWDELARQAGIEPRALKTYRLPEEADDFCLIPPVVHQALEFLVAHPIRTSQPVSAIVPALAWLVMSQARVAIIDKQIISGLDRYRGSRNGLSAHERRIMALISRHCLLNGLPDHGGEIHDLLRFCTRPLGEWIGIPGVIDAVYADIVLIDDEDGIPTPEAGELAATFSTLSAHVEEELFAKFKEALGKYSEEAGNDYYTAVRGFIVRNPVATNAKLFDLGKSLPSALWMLVQNEFYETVPLALTVNGEVQLCAHCRSLVRPHNGAFRCQSRACSQVHPAMIGETLSSTDCRRVMRAIRQYWVEPGIDEIRMFDAISVANIQTMLYPEKDRVDISVGEHLGIDLKTYASPEILGAKFRRSIGGLAFYSEKWLVVPDWLVEQTPAYIDRLTAALGENAIRVKCLPLKKAVQLVLKIRTNGAD